MFNTIDLKQFVIEPVLREAKLYTESAVNLLLGTAAQESQMVTYYTHTNGQAIGLFQMSPDRHNDLWKNFLNNKAETSAYIVTLEALAYPHKPRTDLMLWNLRYAALMCRMQYYRYPFLLPEADDVRGLAEYWNKYYNTTIKARGTVEQFVKNYHRFVLQ